MVLICPILSKGVTGLQVLPKIIASCHKYKQGFLSTSVPWQKRSRSTPYIKCISIKINRIHQMIHALEEEKRPVGHIHQTADKDRPEFWTSARLSHELLDLIESHMRNPKNHNLTNYKYKYQRNRSPLPEWPRGIAKPIYPLCTFHNCKPFINSAMNGPQANGNDVRSCNTQPLTTNGQ